jgi:hypothetical protein
MLIIRTIGSMDACEIAKALSIISPQTHQLVLLFIL